MRKAGLGEAEAGIKIAGRNINNLRQGDDHPYGRKWRKTKEPLDESERREWKSWLKAQHSENEDHGITSWEIDGETVVDFIFGGSKVLQMLIAAMKLKDTPSKENYDQPR